MNLSQGNHKLRLKNVYERENHWPAVSHWQTLSHNVVSSTPHLSKIRTHNVNGEGTDCIGSCKSNYHTTMATAAPHGLKIKNTRQ